MLKIKIKKPIMCKKSKTYQACSDENSELDILFGVINRFIGYFTRDSIKKTKNDTKIEYPFVPMDTRQAYQQIIIAKQYLDSKTEQEKAPKFIDIGCGIGQIVLIAEMAGFDAHGIEKDPYPCEIAQRLIGADKILLEDIWEFNEYNKFDVIYYFRPFSIKELQSKFEKMIEDKIKVGGIIIGNRRLSNSIEKDERFRKLNSNWPVWEKITH